MALHRDDGRPVPKITSINQFTGLENFGAREVRWACDYLNLSMQFSLGINSSMYQKMEILYNHIKNNQDKENLIKNLIIAKENFLLDKSYLEWINNDDYRVITWIINRIISEFNIQPQIGINSNLYEDLIFNLDYLKIEINSKINFIQHKRAEWPRIQTSEKDTKWLIPDNIIQLKWALEYMVKFGKIVFMPYPPILAKEYYDLILASLDLMTYGNPSDKKLFLEKMKKTWSQKKFRDSGKAKKPYHIPLTKSTQAQLEQLADFKNLRKEQVIEELINKEYEATHLDEKGKNKYRLK